MKDSSTDQQLNDLISRARRETPLGLPRAYGFETRIRETIRNSESGTLDFFNTLCWRFSLVCLPVVVPAVAAIAVMHGLQLPDGISTIVGYFNLGSISGF